MATIKNKKALRWIPAIFGVLVVGGVASGMILVIQKFMEKPPQTKKFVQQISLIKPPPPPSKIEQPPEQEIEEVKVEQPKDVAEEMPDTLDDLPPMGDQLGLDADVVAGLDGFGLIGKKGGRGLLEGTESDREFTWYSGIIQDDIYNWLSERDELRKHRYSIKVKLWVNKDGNIKDLKLMESSGDKTIDKKLSVALAQMRQFSEKPPQGMPQPIKLQISSRL